MTSDREAMASDLAAENRELRAYLKAFCAATVDTEERGHDVEVHEANPFIEWEFGLVDEGSKPGRVITSGQVRRAMELVGFDKLKIEPASRTISDDLTEARDLRRQVAAVRRILARTYSTEIQRDRVSAMVADSADGEDIARVVTDARLLHDIAALVLDTPTSED